jgi:glycosyltransferase involved in cell wall biosynthesis
MSQVSICIPTYKQPECVVRLLDSIYIQTFADFEVVISDNCPDDSIKTVIDKYSPNKIIYNRNSPALSMTENWNNAIKLSKASYVKIMFSDDWFTHNHSLLEFVKMLDDNPEADFAFSGSIDIGPNKKRPHSMSKSNAIEIRKSPERLFIGNFIGAPSATIFKRSKHEFDKALKWRVDLEFYIQLLLENNNFVFTTEPLVSIGIHESQVTNDCVNNRALNLFENAYIYDKLHLHTNKKCKKYMLSILGDYRASFGEMRESGFTRIDYVFLKFARFLKLKEMKFILKKILSRMNIFHFNQ